MDSDMSIATATSDAGAILVVFQTRRMGAAVPSLASLLIGVRAAMLI
jgi:hypothetical protein